MQPLQLRQQGLSVLALLTEQYSNLLLTHILSHFIYTTKHDSLNFQFIYTFIYILKTVSANTA